MSERISIEQIRTDGGTQTRSGLNMTTVTEYAEEMKSGTSFPPVVVFHDGASLWLADGFHRLSAAAVAGRDKVDADVRQGTRREAVLFSTGANATHGLRRSNYDKRRAVETLLRDDEWRQWSNREIARHCFVDEGTVRNVRREMETTAEIPQSGVRKTADGREMNTASIGQPERPRPSTSVAYMTNIYRAWRKTYPNDQIVLIDMGGVFSAIHTDSSILRSHEFAYQLECGSIGLAGGADYMLVTKIDPGLVEELVRRQRTPILARYSDLSDDMKFLADKVKNARNIPLQKYDDWFLKFGKPAANEQPAFGHLDAERIRALADRSFIDRYKALEKEAPEGSITVVLTHEAAIAFRESAKRADRAMGEKSQLVDTEYGLAVFWTRSQATMDGQLYDLSESFPVRVYNDFSQAASDFYLHHQRRLAMARRKAEEPRRLTIPARPGDHGQPQLPFSEAPKFKVGAHVVLRSGHAGVIVDDWPTVKTVNWTRHYKAEYLRPDPRDPSEIRLSGDGHIMTPDEQVAGWQPAVESAARQLEDYKSGDIVAVVPALRRVFDFLDDEDSVLQDSLKADVWACLKFFDSATEVIEAELAQRVRMGLMAERGEG